MKKLLTIAIPTYNRKDACHTTLKNFINQILQNKLENDVVIMVSDNCSDDGTFQMLVNLKEQYPDLIMINKNVSNLGFAKNILYLINNCATEYIWTCGDDDTYFDDSLITVVSILKDKKPVYLFMNCEWPQPNGSSKKGVKISEDFYGSFIDAMDIVRDSASYMSLNVIKTELVKKANWYSETWIVYEKIMTIEPIGNAYVIARPLVRYSYADVETNWFYQDEKQLLFFNEMLHFVLLEKKNKALSKFRFHMLNLYGNMFEDYLNVLRAKNGIKNINFFKYKKYKKIYHILLITVILEFVIIFMLFYIHFWSA